MGAGLPCFFVGCFCRGYFVWLVAYVASHVFCFVWRVFFKVLFYAFFFPGMCLVVSVTTCWCVSLLFVLSFVLLCCCRYARYGFG